MNFCIIQISSKNNENLSNCIEKLKKNPFKIVIYSPDKYVNNLLKEFIQIDNISQLTSIMEDSTQFTLFLDVLCINEFVVYHLIDNYEKCLQLLPNKGKYLQVKCNNCYWIKNTNKSIILQNEIIEDKRYVYHFKNIKIDQIKMQINNENVKITRKIYGVYFICCIGNYHNIVSTQLSRLIDSELYQNTDQIFCFICKQTPEIHKLLSKYSKITIIATDENLFEKYAINNFKKYINGEYYLYYIHTKTVTKNVQSFIDWRLVCEYFTINKWKLNLKLLKYYDTVGISLFNFPKKHYSGNFWWSTSENIETLADINNNYLSPEMYVCSNENKKHISIYQTFRMMGALYPPELYEKLSDAEIINNISEIPYFLEVFKNLPC